MKYLLHSEETDRLISRKILEEDFNHWLDFFKDTSSFEHWAGQLEEPEVECRKWFERQAERYKNDLGGMNALIERKSGELVGYAGLLVQTVDKNPELEVAYSLLHPYRNKGFASEAAMKCKDIAFESNYFDSLISIISLTNTPSARVALKNGMKIEKQTIYKENQVNIFRIHHSDWQNKIR